MMKKPVRDTIKTIIENWRKIGLIVIFDILFIILLFNLRFVFIRFNTWFYGLISVLNQILWLASSIIIIIVILLLLILIYSFFKYIVLYYIQSIFKKTKFDFAVFIPFLKTNLVAAVPIAAPIIVFVILMSLYFDDLVLAGTSNAFQFLFMLLVIVIIELIVFIYSYTLLNLFHNTFIKEKGLKKVIKKALIDSFKFDSYRVYWANFKVVIISGILLLIIHILMKFLVFTSVTAYLSYYGYYRFFLLAYFILIVYFLLLLNRIYFYLLCNKSK